MFNFGDKTNRTLAGAPYQVKFTKRRKGGGGTLRISVRVNSRAEFKITKESVVAKLGKAIGLAVELQSGDPQFDKAFYLCTDSPKFTSNLLQNPEVRGNIAKLLGGEFHTLRHDGSELFTTLLSGSSAVQNDTALIHAAVESLNRIAAEISKTRSLGEDHLLSSSTKRTIVNSICAAVVLLGIVFIVWGSNSYEPVSSSAVWLGAFPAVSILLVSSLVGMFLFVRGRSSSTSEFLRFFACALLGIPMCGYGITTIINGRGDSGEARVYTQVISDRYTTKSKKKGTKYHIRYNSWHREDGALTRTVSQQQYNSISPGRSSIQFSIKPGTLGYEWIESYKIIP